MTTHYPIHILLFFSASNAKSSIFHGFPCDFPRSEFRTTFQPTLRLPRIKGGAQVSSKHPSICQAFSFPDWVLSLPLTVLSEQAICVDGAVNHSALILWSYST